MTTAEQLRRPHRATAEIRAVRRSLNDRHCRRTACGCKAYQDKDQWQQARALDACLNRLRAVIATCRV